MKRLHQALFMLFAASLALSPTLAHAESGRLNLHLDLGLGLPTAGYQAPSGQNDLNAHWGVAGWLSVDYVVAGPFAVEIIGGVGRMINTVDGTNPYDRNRPIPDGFTWGTIGAGGRLRLLDDGNLWLSAHAGYQRYAGNQFGLDGAVGYEFAVSDPIQVGVFLRGMLGFGGDAPSWVLNPEDQVTAALFLGVNGSFALIGNDNEPTTVVENAPVVIHHRRHDRDGDGIHDPDDTCPDEPEDVDTFQDTDGCPDTDNDADTILDAADRCPIEAEDMDQYEDTDGCPDPDNDADGVLDAADQCPAEAGPESNHGCPDPDDDSDTVPNRVDNCPQEAGTVEFQGCPQAQLVTIVGDHLVILEKVMFRTGSATIDRHSYPLLNNVAAVLNAHPEIHHLRVEGHTDAQGNAARNMTLSQKRAQAVVTYLTRRGGVEATRLVAEGFGPNRPLVPNATTEAEFEQNRRVEFVVVD